MTTKTITQTGWIYWDADYAKWYPRKEEKHYRFYLGEKSEGTTCGIPVCEATISFEVPAEFDPREPQIAVLKAKKAQLQAEFTARVTEIEREISKLQALEFTPA
jgi:hypothetical protein